MVVASSTPQTRTSPSPWRRITGTASPHRLFSNPDTERQTNCFRQIAMPWNNLSKSLSLSLSFARSLTRCTFFPLHLVSTPKLSRRFARSSNGPYVEVGRWRWKELQTLKVKVDCTPHIFSPSLRIFITNMKIV